MTMTMTMMIQFDGDDSSRFDGGDGGDSMATQFYGGSDSSRFNGVGDDGDDSSRFDDGFL